MQKKIITAILFFVYVLSFGQDVIFIEPTDYHGIIADVTNSAKAEALGKNTITLDGIRTSFENPATISPGNNQLQVAVNYTKGHPFNPKSYYNFAGISYRVSKKIVVGVTTHHWVDPQSYWSAEIGGSVFDTDKKAQHTYSLLAAAEIIEGLHFGATGNFLRDEEIEGKNTGKEFVMNAGLIYDKSVEFIKKDNVSNETIRLAASLFNVLMDGQIIQRANDSVWQYRDMPIILRIGGAYSFSLPLHLPFAQKSKKLQEAPQTIDLSVRLQYGNWLKDDKHIYHEYKDQTMINFGLEALAFNLLALRLGYFSETRGAGTGNNVNDRYGTKDKRKGLTWGLGCIIPADKWSTNKLPFEIRFDILAKNHPDWLDESLTTRVNKDFTDKKLMLALGIELNIK